MAQEELRIQQGAIFIADSHHHSLYQNTLDSVFQNLLQSPRRQIFLMGDIFDFLVGGVQKALEDNQTTLQLLEQLSKIHEIYYFEGNHDFLLSKIPYFKNIRCFPLEVQPICFKFSEKQAYLAHGDIFLNWHYALYVKIMRQPFLIKFLNFLSFFLYQKILSYSQKKIRFKKQNQDSNQLPLNSEELVISRINKYQKNLNIPAESYIIEGHFHWGKSVKFNQMNYIGLPFFACKKKYFVVEYANYCLSLIEKEF
ncbi:metallophosphoesterase [Helicobacter sp. MIT 05-5294]|uniref:UDP-2,3-diacylglucosamine diphosphatase n=1 Tax=Helicobacter sp. MIT 05-5294 TaxID=1548150 RepID=UPI0010FE8FCA|nr:metallophosphoesterase [Helicobacter sp. MIT 05-5294]TLD87523.1 metallophosphoesterase [Helicobacter sp. MIT 05-5294]